MSRPLSRPRTHIYNANYNIGESYYKSALDSIDRKHLGRPLTPPRNHSLPRDLLERHERAFADEDLPSARLRAEKHISEPSFLDARNPRSRALEAFENDFDEETASALKRIRASKKVSIIDDIGMDSTVNSLTAKRIKERSDKLLDTVGISENSASSRRGLDDEVAIKRRSLRISYDDPVDGAELTKWTPLESNKEESGASLRVKQSRARLLELEDEMNSLNERQVARERRAARLRQMVADFDDGDDVQAVQSVRVSRRERTVEDV